MAQQYTNIRRVLDRIMRHPLMQDISLETAVDYTVDFMRIIGSPAIFEDKVETLMIEDYRAMLPCDFHKMTQVRKSNEVFRYTTDSFHLSQDSKDKPFDLTYKIQGNVIYTNIKSGEIEIAYTAFLVDKDGYPLIPDNSSFLRALELYIKKQWFTILFDLGKINPQIYQNVQQEYAWAVGDCQSEFNRISIDEAESIFNDWKSLIIKDNEHAHGFRNTGSKRVVKVK